jgi:hypothetical protein
MYQCICVSQVVQEPVSETFAHVCAWHETSNIKKFYRNGSPSFDTAAVVGFATVGEVEAGAWAFDLKVADGTLGVDGCESG